MEHKDTESIRLGAAVMEKTNGYRIRQEDEEKKNTRENEHATRLKQIKWRKAAGSKGGFQAQEVGDLRD